MIDDRWMMIKQKNQQLKCIKMQIQDTKTTTNNKQQQQQQQKQQQTTTNNKQQRQQQGED